jgi:hypothetical protein
MKVNREIVKPFITFLYNKEMYFVLFILLFSFKINANTTPANPVVSDSLYCNITVKTNINCITCNYSAQISDPISITTNSIKDQFSLESGWQLIPVSQINCHNKIMNNDMQDMLHAAIYPNIKIKISPFQIDKEPWTERKGILTVSINGVYRSYEVFLKNCIKNQYLCILGSISVNLKDFGITPPTKFFGLVMVDKTININFNLLIDTANLNRLLTSKDNSSIGKNEINK